MNLDLFVQNLVKEITQTVSTVPGVEPGQEGEDFESMLVKQSKDAHAQRRKERPEEKPASKKEVEKNQEDSTQEEEVPKDGSQLAAALVTSQPVVLFGMPVENAGEAQAAAGVLDAAAAEILPEAAEGQLDQPGQQLPVEETAEEAVQPVLDETLVELPKTQEAVEAEAPVARPEEDLQPELDQRPVEVKASKGQEMEPQLQKAEKDQPQEAGMAEAWTGSRPVFRSNDAMPEKVGENYETLTPEAEDAPQKLAATLTQALERGQSRVEIQLNPANLGKLTVEITRNVDGALSVVLITVNEKAAVILRQHSGALQTAMMSSAQAPVTVEVQQPQQAEDPNQFLNPDGHNDQNQQQQQKQERQHKGANEDFLQQLRLGLVGLNQE